MNIDKVASRAHEVAKKLGVEFTPPSIKESSDKAMKRIKNHQEYISKKEQYDACISNIIEHYSKEDIIEFIRSNDKSLKP